MPRCRLHLDQLIPGSNGMDALFQMGSNVPTLGVVSPPKLKERSP